MSDYHHIRIKVSKRQVAKLRKGHKVRIAAHTDPMNGEGVSLIVNPERYQVVTKTFAKGRGLEVALSPEEIMLNKKHAHHLKGQGIFGDKFDRFVERTIGKKAKDTIYNAADKLKAPIKRGIDKLAEHAPTIGASALSGLALAAGQPELIPAAGMLGSKLGSFLGRKGSEAAKDYLDHPSTYHNMFTSNVGGNRNMIAPATLAGQVAQNHLFHNLNQELGTHYGNLAQANLSNAVAHMDRSNLTSDGFGGRGLRRERGSVGLRSSFVGSNHSLPPALMSQPFSANFQFQHTLPPAYQKFSRGGGLYA